MDRIPFSAYDFFGYLSSGFLILVAYDFAADAGYYRGGDLHLVEGLFLLILCYVIGHLVAHFASLLLEKRLVHRTIGPAARALLSEKPSGWRRRLFPGYFTPLPARSRERIVAAAVRKADIQEPGDALFLHAWASVKAEQGTIDRLNSFINLYGFCRNLCMTALLTLPILAVGSLRHPQRPTPYWSWMIAGLLISIGMFYRYLKFYRHYAVEVLTTYAELP